MEDIKPFGIQRPLAGSSSKAGRRARVDRLKEGFSTGSSIGGSSVSAGGLWSDANSVEGSGKILGQGR